MARRIKGAAVEVVMLASSGVQEVPNPILLLLLRDLLLLRLEVEKKNCLVDRERDLG